MCLLDRPSLAGDHDIDRGEHDGCHQGVCQLAAKSIRLFDNATVEDVDSLIVEHDSGRVEPLHARPPSVAGIDRPSLAEKAQHISLHDDVRAAAVHRAHVGLEAHQPSRTVRRARANVHRVDTVQTPSSHEASTTDNGERGEAGNHHNQR